MQRSSEARCHGDEMKRTAFAILSGAFFLLFLCRSGFAQSRTVWEIGKFDQSSREFAAPASDHVVYTAGKDNWAAVWPGQEQTGAAYEIRFHLDAAPRGLYTLKVSLLTGYLHVPDLRVDLNGYVGTYFVRTKPLYTGDSSVWADMTIDLPAAYLKKGENRLVLSPVGGEGAAASAAPESFRYDFIGLTNDRRPKGSAGSMQADVIPTVFYRSKGGQLYEVVDAFLRFRRPFSAGRAVLTVKGKKYSAAIGAGGAFGETKVEFEVQQWQGTAAATLEVSAGGDRSWPLSLTAERKWTVFVVPHTHVDIGYTDYQGKVAENQANTLEEAADLIGKHPDFRFATDGSWNVRQFLDTRSEAQRNRLFELIRTNRIAVPADYFNLLTGYASLETLYRSLYYTKQLSIRHRLPFDYATTTDVPSYTGAYPSILAGSGIKYWAVGANQDRAPVLMHEQWNEKSPFWWEGPDGKKVLVWYSWSYSQIWRFFTAEPTNTLIRESLPAFLAPYDKETYRPDAVLMYGAQFENTDLHPQLATFVSAWNDAYAYPKLQYATFSDFFRYIDKNYGAMLPTCKGDMGPYWEDGIGSDAYYAAEDRNNQSHALSAEILSTAAHIVNPDVHPPREELQSAWNNILLFAEHTWGAGNSIWQPDSEQAVRQLAVKDNYATQAHFELEDLTNRSLYQLANRIDVPGNTLVVFNGLNWRRSALIEADFRRNQELIDLATNRKIPIEAMWEKEGFVHARFLAPDLPPVGYKCFQIRSVSGQASKMQAEASPVIENRFYRIVVDPESGAVRSIFDKELNREVADTGSPYRFGQYLYVTGGDPKGDGLTRMIHPNLSLPAAELTVHPATDGRYLGSEQTPWGYSIRLRSADVNTPEIDTEILLFDDEKKIEFRYTVEKNYTTAKEAVYFAFPAAVASPEFAYATQQGWVDPARDMLKGASLEWFSVQKWMAVCDSGMTVGIVPIDASLASFGDINRGLWPSVFQPKSATLFSYAMNNYWHTNYRAGQGGEFTFRYVLTSAGQFQPAALSRLGWESMEAPLVDAVANNDKAGNPNEPLPASGTSFLRIDNPDIVLVTWKLAEDGRGTILRLKEIAGRNEDVSIEFPRGRIRSAALCNSVEDDEQALNVAENAVSLKFRPHEVLTVRLMP
jgi:alpha-mannosidase